MTAEDKHKIRTRLSEWSKTPEGKAKYEQVAQEMREQIAYNTFDKEIESYWDKICKPDLKLG